MQRSGSSRTSHGSTPHGVTRQAALLSHAAGVIFSFPFRGVPSSGRRADLRPPTLGQLAARAAGRVWRLVGEGAVELRACVASGMVSGTSLTSVGLCARHTGPHHRVSRRRQAAGHPAHAASTRRERCAPLTLASSLFPTHLAPSTTVWIPRRAASVRSAPVLLSRQTRRRVVCESPTLAVATPPSSQLSLPWATSPRPSALAIRHG